MKKFSIRLGKLNTEDILELIGAGICMLGAFAAVTDVTDRLAYVHGQNDALVYLKRTSQYDTTDISEIQRRGKVYDAKQFLAENKDVK